MSNDLSIRMTAFEHVNNLRESRERLTRADLSAGFMYEGKRIPLINPQRGIFKPQQMEHLLSILTSVPRPGGRVWYDDQNKIQKQIYAEKEELQYSFMGTNPNHADNRWLREAMETKTPIIYFLGVAPGLYQAFLPTFIVGWDPRALKARIAFGEQDGMSMDYPDSEIERRYALSTVKTRLHQATFREAVITAYGGRCALSGTPEPLLLDAAHIVSDKHEDLGQPIVPNGLSLTKIHHAAFDSHLIGIDPDYKIHVSERLLTLRDGPMLESMKDLAGRTIHLPEREKDYPDRDRLAFQFERFKSAA